MSKFSMRLRELRISRELSQQKLADIMGTSKSSINMYERGEREPGIEMLEAFADYFNVDLNYLLGTSNIPNRMFDTSKFFSTFPMFGKNLKIVRKQHNLTLEKLAELYNDTFPGSGMSKGTLSKYESEKQEPMISTVGKLAKILNISTDFLMGNDSKENDALIADTNSEHNLIIELYSKLDIEDKAEIRGEMKQMLKADKYGTHETPIPLTPRKIAAYGADGTKQTNPPKNPRKIT